MPHNASGSILFIKVNDLWNHRNPEGDSQPLIHTTAGTILIISLNFYFIFV